MFIIAVSFLSQGSLHRSSPFFLYCQGFSFYLSHHELKGYLESLLFHCYFLNILTPVKHF